MVFLEVFPKLASGFSPDLWQPIRGQGSFVIIKPLPRYRAVVLEQTATDCNVRFVDYGNTSKVTKDKLKLLTEEHLALPATCLNVRLGTLAMKIEIKFPRKNGACKKNNLGA